MNLIFNLFTFCAATGVTLSFIILLLQGSKLIVRHITRFDTYEDVAHIINTYSIVLFAIFLICACASFGLGSLLKVNNII